MSKAKKFLKTNVTTAKLLQAAGEEVYKHIPQQNYFIPYEECSSEQFRGVLYMKHFYCFMSGLKELFGVSGSAEQSICNNRDASEFFNRVGKETVRSSVETQLHAHDMGDTTEITEVYTMYKTTNGIQFGWREMTDGFVFWIGFGREGSISENAKKAGFKKIFSIPVPDSMRLDRDGRALAQAQNVLEKIEEAGMTLVQVLTLPQIRDYKDMHLSMQSRHERYECKEPAWQSVKYPCVLVVDKYEGSNMVSRTTYHEYLLLSAHDKDNNSGILICSDCSSSDCYGSNAQFGLRLKKMKEIFS